MFERLTSFFVRRPGKTVVGRRIRFQDGEGPLANILTGMSGNISRVVTLSGDSNEYICIDLSCSIELPDRSSASVVAVPRHIGYSSERLLLRSTIAVYVLGCDAVIPCCVTNPDNIIAVMDIKLE